MRTMDYELAKELKEKGFPQKSFLTYKPTLSELIDACKCPNLFLERYTGRNPLNYRDTEERTWWEVTDDKKNGCYMENTAEQAIAKLWLALNK